MTKTIMGYSLAQKVCKAMGLDPGQVKIMTLVLKPDEPAMWHVELYASHEVIEVSEYEVEEVADGAKPLPADYSETAK